MKKVFGLFLSLIVLMGLSACEKGYSTLTFVASGESSVTLVKVGEPFDISLEYSMDGKNWKPYTIGETIFLLEDKLSFRAEESGNKRFSKDKDDYYQFRISGDIDAKGSIMSLLDRSDRKDTVPSYAFFNLFRDCTGLTKAPALPATALAEGCYSGMFSGCTSLTKVPALPATVLALTCYCDMFTGCTNLKKAPVLPATEMASSCYYDMFSGCTSLKKAPALPATELAWGCYEGMFYGCTSLKKAPALPAMELAVSCYRSMFIGCTSLKKAPVLPATELVMYCYSSMFYGCKSLNYVKAMFINNRPSLGATSYWLWGVSPTGTFVKSKDATWDVRGSSGIPDGWNVVTE